MDEMRKAFEAWAKESGWGIDKIGSGEGWDGTYTNTAVRFMWEAWQAACTAEREACAQVCDEAAIRLFSGKSRVNQFDRRTAEVLRSKAGAIRARSQQ